MPHYDESFINDDNVNQRRNKRSYRVYKNGINPFNVLDRTDVLQTLEDRGTFVIKRNIRNIKHRGQKFKPESQNNAQSINSGYQKTPDILIDHYPQINVFDTNNYYDLKNNNVLPLTPCKSFDNLTLKIGKKDELLKEKIKYGASLQNLAYEGNLKHYASPLEEGLPSSRRDASKNSYSVIEARRRPAQRRVSRSTVTPGVGIYRQINNDGVCPKAVTGRFIVIVNDFTVIDIECMHSC